MLYSKLKRHWVASCTSRRISQSSNQISLGPRFRIETLTFSWNNTFCYIAYITHSRIHRTIIVVTRLSKHPPWRSSWTNAYLANSKNYSLIPVKPRWHLVLKHRWNIGKPSFCKIQPETPVHGTLRTALSNIYRVPCESVRWFRILVRTKNRPSSIIIRYAVPQCSGGVSPSTLLHYVILAWIRAVMVPERPPVRTHYHIICP